MPLAAFPKCFLPAMCVTREMSVDQWLDMAAAFDVDGYEFYWPFTPHENPAELERIRRRVEAQGRSIPMMCYSPDFTQARPCGPQSRSGSRETRHPNLPNPRRKVLACAQRPEAP